LWLLARIVVIGILLGIATWWLDGDSLPRIVGFFYKRVTWFVVLAAVMSTTWTFNGGPGWFPMIVVTLFNVGAAATGGAIQPLPLDGFVANPVGGLTLLPGEIIVMGGDMFTQLLQLGTTGQGGILGIIGTVIDTVVTGDALDPIMTAIGYIVTLISAVTCFIVCGYIAVRYALTIMQVLYFAVFSFFQAALGSNRFAGIGGSFVDGAISLGAELGMVAAFAGIGEVMIKGAIGYTPSNPFVTLIPYVGTGAKAASIGVMLVLDALLVFWAFMVRSAPDFAQRLLHGGFSANMGQLSSALSGSSNPIARMAGGGMSTLETGATRGGGHLAAQTASKLAGGAAQVALGAAGGIGKSGGTAAAHGALQGMMMGGIPGAVLGGLGGMIGSKAAHQLKKGDGAGGGDGASADSMRGSGRSSGPDSMRGSDRATRTGASAGVDAAAAGGSGDTTRTQTVTTQVLDRTVRASAGGDGGGGGGGGASGSVGSAFGAAGATGAGRSAGGSPGGGVGSGGAGSGAGGGGGSAGASSPSGSDSSGGGASGGGSNSTDGAFVNSGGYAWGVTPFGESATGWRAAANGIATETMSGMRMHNSIGDMIARRAMYMSGAKAAQAPPAIHEDPVRVGVGAGLGGQNR
ncbi:MAG TPA: hypothetical protein VNF68_12550, partial [Candidatus Baltobacteraceae bacterium]|nr:hypothetical protein [Candidatus Baltobacteraceae bacterium]